MRILTASLVIACGAALTGSTARGVVVGTESFNYANGPSVGQSGGTGWNWNNIDKVHEGASSSWVDAWNGANTSIVDNALVTLNGGVRRAYRSDDMQAALRAEGVVYYAVNIRHDGVEWGGVSAYDFGDERLFWGVPGTQGETKYFGIDSFAGLSFSSIPAVVGQTYRIVSRLDFDNNEIAIWVNPTAADLGSSVASREYTGTNWNTGLRLASGGGTATFDDLVVGTTWADVVAVPEPSMLSIGVLAAAGLLIRRRA